MPASLPYHRIYMSRRLVCVQRNMPATCVVPLLTRSIAMLDVVYILIGAAFLGGCVLTPSPATV